MKERPILFSPEMIIALHKGIKTQTRRPLKLPKWSTGNWKDFELDDDGSPMIICRYTTCLAQIQCPYGDPSDHLWVKEKWRLVELNTLIKGARFMTIQFSDTAVLPYMNNWRELIEPLKRNDKLQIGSIGDSYGRWRSSLFLPRWASRSTLEIVHRKAERLQTIDADDAVAEGVPNGAYSLHPIEAYKRIWDSINALSYPYCTNPWVWRIEFKVI